MQMSLIEIFECVGVAAFAVSGTYVAIERRLDLFGIYIIAFATATGGGIIRDVVMDAGVPVFFSSYLVIGIVLLSATIALLFRQNNKMLHILMHVSDALGLSVFAINAGVKAIVQGYNFPQFLFVSTITAVGGGIVRDLLCQRVPVILRKEVYALCAMLGSTLLWFVYPLIGMNLAMYISIAFVMTARLLCVYFKTGLPVLRTEK